MLTIRFQEYQMYDISKDCDVVTLMATTGKGSYHACVSVKDSKSLREKRMLFRERAIEALKAGVNPCEVKLD